MTVRRSGPPSPCLPGPFVSDVLGVGSNEVPEPFMGGSHVGSSKADPPRVIPEIGQVSENTAECPQNKPWPLSHTSRAGFHVAIGFGTCHTPHVFPHHEARS